MFNDFIKLLNPKLNEIKYNSVNIETQKVFELSDNSKAIPDIVITLDKMLILIEVKVSSELNRHEYKINDEIINFESN